MPLAPQAAAPDTSELNAPGQVAAPQLPEEGTGASGPKYSALDVWAAAANQTIVGQGVRNVQLASQTGADRSLAEVDYNAPPAPIPEEMLPYKDKYVGLQTPEEVAYRTEQIKANLRDQQAVGSSKLGFVAALGLGVSDPVALASMAIPIGGEGVAVSRLGMAARMAGVGAGVSVADEALLHQMDPTHTWQGALTNVGAGTLISGVLGGLIRPHVPPAEFDQLRTRLQEDLTRPVATAPAGASGGITDSATQIAQDIRTRLQDHVADLQARAATAQGVDHEELAGRIAQAREALRTTSPPLEEAARAQAVQDETARLATPDGVRERLEAQYGEDLPRVLQERAEANVAAREGESTQLRQSAQGEADRGAADTQRVQAGQAAQEELDRISQILRPGRPPETPAEPVLPAGSEHAAAGEPQGYSVSQGELTDELKARFQGLRSELQPEQAAHATGEREPRGAVPAGPARRGARAAEGERGAGGEPLPVYRGAAAALEPGHFEPGAFGHATARPSAGLGVFFTSDKAEAGQYGTVTTHHLDLRNPLHVAVEDLPAFDSKEDATAWSRQQEAAGHDGLVIDASHLGGQTWYVPFKFAQVLKPGGLEAAAQKAAALERAPTVPQKRAVGDEVLRAQLQAMADEGGWAQVGGRVIRESGTGPEEGQGSLAGTGEGAVIGRTSWIPNAEWWPGRPVGYNTQQVKDIVAKALAGERLGPKQQQLLEYMTEVADARVANAPYLPKPEHFSDLDGLLDPGSVSDVHEVAMVTRLSLIDEEAVETLARHFENDDAGFMRAVKETLDAHDTDAGLARSLPPEREVPGFLEHGAATERAAGPPGRPGEGGDTAHARESPTGGGRPAERDLFGVRPSTAQSLSDETARRDRARNSGQDSVETGRADDLFSQAVRQADLTDALKVLPQSDRETFAARLAALEPAPIISAPQDSTAGAMQVGNGLTLKDLSVARGGRVIGKTLGWFAPGSRVLRSPSIEVRKAAISLVETPEMLEMNIPTPERPFGLSTPPAVETLLKRWEGTWATGFKARDQIYRAYRTRPLTADSPEIGVTAEHLSRREFNDEVSAAMRRGDQHVIPEVGEAARATRKLVIDPLKAEAQKLGMLPQQLEGTLQGTAESYLMRQYDRPKINADQVGWHQKLVDGFRAQGMDAAEATDIAHQVTRNILGVETGLMDYNENIFAKVIPQSGRLQARTLMLPDAHLEQYLVNDIDTLSHSYLKSLAPQVEVTKRFGDKDMTEAFQSIRDEYAALSQRALAQGDSAAAGKVLDRQSADVRDLMAMRDRLYGVFGVPSDPKNWFMRASRIIRSVNAFRMLGTATWSHIPDLANVVMRRGLTGTMGAALKLSTSLEALNLNRAELQRMGTALDMIHNSTSALLGEFGVESNYAVQKALNRGTRAFTIATLETPWIATVKALAGAGAQDELLSAAQRASTGQLSRIERIRFNQAGVSQEAMQRIAEEFATHGKTVNGLRFGMSDKWADQNTASLFEASINRHAEASTLSPSKGDTPLYTSTEWGKALFQFKTFGAVAIRKVVIPLAQGLAHADLRSASGLATLIAAGAATYTMKQKLSGQPIEKDPTRYALEVLDKSNLLGWTSEYFYPALWAGGMQNFSRWGDRQTWETLGGPVIGAAVDAWDLRLPAKIRAQLTSDTQQGKFTRADIHRIRRMLPANQVWYLRRAVNNLEGHVGDAMNLPPDAPRGSTE